MCIIILNIFRKIVPWVRFKSALELCGCRHQATGGRKMFVTLFCCFSLFCCFRQRFKSHEVSDGGKRNIQVVVLRDASSCPLCFSVVFLCLQDMQMTTASTVWDSDLWGLSQPGCAASPGPTWRFTIHISLESKIQNTEWQWRGTFWHFDWPWGQWRDRKCYQGKTITECIPARWARVPRLLPVGCLTKTLARLEAPMCGARGLHHGPSGEGRATAWPLPQFLLLPK